jgi:hypothetical protein
MSLVQLGKMYCDRSPYPKTVQNATIEYHHLEKINRSSDTVTQLSQQNTISSFSFKVAINAEDFLRRGHKERRSDIFVFICNNHT